MTGEPTPGASAGHPTRFKWESTIRRCRFTGLAGGSGKRGGVSHTTFFAVAMTWATHANPDGSAIFAGTATVTVETGSSYKTVKLVTAKLVALGLLVLVKRGNRRAGQFDEYRLGLPDDLGERITVLTPEQVKKEAAAIREEYRTHSSSRGPKDPVNEPTTRGPEDPSDENITGSNGPADPLITGSTGPASRGPVDRGTYPFAPSPSKDLTKPSLSTRETPTGGGSTDLALVQSEERERGGVESDFQKPKDAAHEVLADIGIAGEEADQIVSAMYYIGKVGTKGPGWWREVAKRGDLPANVELARERISVFSGALFDNTDRPEPARMMSNSEYEASVRGEPDCGHGYSGGGIPRSGDGWMVCAICRARAGREAALAAASPPRVTLPSGYDPDDVLEGIVIDDEGDAA